MGPRSRIALALASTWLIALGAATASAQAPVDPQQFAAPTPATQAAAGADKRSPIPPGPPKSQINLRLHGLNGGKLKVGQEITAAGTLRPFAAGERVTLLLDRGKHTIKRKTVFAKQKRGSNLGKFSLSEKLVKPGRYSIQAIHDTSDKLGGSKDRTRHFKIKYPDLSQGEQGDDVGLFNRLLDAIGYVNDDGRSYDSATGRAVLAFRKVNGMDRTMDANSDIFKKLADGHGGFHLSYPGSGKHVEVDLSRQVMVLAKGDEVDEIYHISSGAPATPTVLGHYNFYRKEPGINSHGMYNSVYFTGGYATHGYYDVPAYPASHGCIRNPIPDSLHIYSWIDLGDDIYVYN